MEIVLLEDLATDARQWLAARHELDYQPLLVDDLPALRRRLYKTSALVVPSRLKINSQLLDFAPRLVAIGRIHDGTENIDFEACQRRRIRVVQASSATVRASAEYLLSTLLTLFRHGVASVAQVGAAPGPLGREINDSVVALFGMSPAAQLLATMLVPLGARVVGYDPAVHRSAELWRRLGVQPMGMNEMLEIADAVSVQLTYASRYQGLIGERVLASCKYGQLWTSVSRPSIYDQEALAATVQSGRIAAFMMDAEDEAISSVDSPLQGVHNLRITPRLAPLTQESQLRGSWYVVDRIHETLLMSEADSHYVPPPHSQPAPLV